ncbi:hypothetical protein CW707_04565 [Candidatus Bathyarchaeota archaeon]|nr:MAG: hypothetical protein CW707_04565 [Candidatus Bathyarchaeota archaeon]
MENKLQSRSKTTTYITLDKNLEEIAIKSAQLIECKIAGIDILESQKGPLVVEVNSQPGWRGLQSTTKVDIADEIVNFIITELKNRGGLSKYAKSK